MNGKLQSNKPGDLNPSWINANVADGYSVAAVGDIIITQPIYQTLRRSDDGLLDILEKADLVVGNFEGSAFDLRHFDGWPEAESGFAWLLSPPEVAADLRRCGFDAIARANNHATDWGVRGMRMTDELLADAGVAIAGTGSSLAAARAPAYVYGPEAVASLVSLTTTFERNAPAVDALGQISARPGASTLGTTPVVMVSEAQLEAIRQIRDAQSAESRPQILIDFDARAEFVTLFGTHYKAWPEGVAQREVQVHYKMDEQDLASILLNVRQAKQTSDFAVVASHTHEPNNWTLTPPNFLPDLAHRCIDNGADMVCTHGPHQLRGIEIYRGKPIFYSLGNFCFMDNAQPVVTREEWERRVWRYLPDRPNLDPDRMTPAEFLEWKRAAILFGEAVWFESVIAVSNFDADGNVRSITLYPIELRYEGRDALRGIPRRIGGPDAVRIMSRLRDLSRPFGTEIGIDMGTGVGTICVSPD